MKTKIVFLSVILFSCFFCNLSAQIPSVKLKDINGKSVDTATLSNEGKPFIISFFATWCKPCYRELNAINEVYTDWQDETGVRLIAVSIDEGQNALRVKPSVDAQGWEYQVLLDSNGDFKRAMGVSMVPHVFIFDAKGNIAEQHSGYTEGAESELIKKVKSLISK